MRLRATPIPIPDGFLDPRKLERAVDNFLDAAAENVRVDFLVTTKTWKNQPEFVVEAPSSQPDTRYVYTRSRIYMFVSGGTRVRYATMTPNFFPKTRPGAIRSNKGRGGVAFISRRHPRPGIQARRFPETIAKKWEGKWVALFTRILRDELKHP